MSELPDDPQPPLKRPSESKDEPVCAKPKKCRRGKKKKFRKRVGDQQNTDESVDSDGFKIPLPPVNAENKPSVHHPNRKRNRKVLIRPVDVPKAPENSTQFIIDDHDECHLYFNFEKPNPFNSSTDSGKSDNYDDDAAFQDIDYQYESLQDLDNSAYYKQDFETNYFNMRYEEMLGMPRQEIMDTIESMETRILELEEKLYEQDPNLALERLQHKLLQLQEEHSLLTEHNSVLRKALENKETGVDTSSNTSMDEGDDVDVNNRSCEECGSSPGSSQHSDDEEEEYVSGEVCSQEDANDLPEYNAQLHITHEQLPDISDDEDEDAEDNVQYVDDIHMLQNNYRAHHISDQSVSHSGNSDHGVDDNEGHKVQENESICTSTVEGYNSVEMGEDSGDDETRVRDIEMQDTQETESARQYDADSSEFGDISQSSHYDDDQKSEPFIVAEDSINSDREEEAIVSSSGITFQEMPDNLPDATDDDVSKSGTNELEDEKNS